MNTIKIYSNHMVKVLGVVVALHVCEIFARFPCNHADNLTFPYRYCVFALGLFEIIRTLLKRNASLLFWLVFALAFSMPFIESQLNVMMSYEKWIERGMPEWGDIGIGDMIRRSTSAAAVSCINDDNEVAEVEDVVVLFQKGCVLQLNGEKYKLSDRIDGAWENEAEFARLRCDLQKYDLVKTKFFIEADREMTHMEFHTCMMGFTCGPFKMYRRNENMHNIAVHAIPLEASWCYRIVDKKDGAYHSFVLCDDKPFSRWDESVHVTEQEGFIDGIDRILPVYRKSSELQFQEPSACPFVDIRCLVTMKVGLLLDFIDTIADKGYERVFVGLLWKPHEQTR